LQAVYFDLKMTSEMPNFSKFPYQKPAIRTILPMSFSFCVGALIGDRRVGERCREHQIGLFNASFCDFPAIAS
jgi:hypothetical protein